MDINELFIQAFTNAKPKIDGKQGRGHTGAAPSKHATQNSAERAFRRAGKITSRQQKRNYKERTNKRGLANAA